MLDQQNAGTASSEETAQAKTVRVWDLPTRLFHWTLFALFVVVWVSHEADGDLFQIHVYSGLAILGLVVFRLVWGIIGSRHARFSDFVRGWSSVRDYGKSMLTFKPPYHVGHNPIGGWMIMGLLILLGLTAFNGLFIADDGYFGPLSGTVSPGVSDALSEIHEGGGGFLLFLVIVHVAGVVVHGLMSKENLPRAMVNGDKTVPAGVKAESIGPVALWRFVVAAAIAVGAVWSIYL